MCGEADKASQLPPPRAFPGIERIFDENGISILYKGINHFKMSIEGDAVEVKAYAALAYFRLYAASEEESGPA